MFMPPPGMSYGQYAQLYGGFPSDTPSISFQPQPSPFARSIRPDRQMGENLMQGPTSLGGRMAAPGTDMATGRPMNPNLFPFNPDPRFSSPVVRRPAPRPSRPDPRPFPTPTPDIFPPQRPPMLPTRNPYGGGGIGGFFNQLAQMSPEQYTSGMDRYNQFQQRFGPSMGGGFGMFNQLAQLSPEQYSMGMDRFNQFNQQFGQMPPRFNQMPPPMTGGPRPNPYGGFPISRPFGGGFGGQRFQPSFQMMPFGGQMMGGSLGPAINNMSMPVFPRPNQQPMTGNVQTQAAPMGLSSPTVEPPDLKGQAALIPQAAGGVF